VAGTFLQASEEGRPGGFILAGFMVSRAWKALSHYDAATGSDRKNGNAFFRAEEGIAENV
jgi:hypothetical protein